MLATGVRPWAHLIEHLSQRTMALQNYVHCPSPVHVASEEQHLEKRVSEMEKSLSKIKSQTAHTTDTTDHVCEYVDDAVSAVVHAMRKQERKWDKYEGKVKEIEQVAIPAKSAATENCQWDDDFEDSTSRLPFDHQLECHWHSPHTFIDRR
jgi:hypothetical protein